MIEINPKLTRKRLLKKLVEAVERSINDSNVSFASATYGALVGAVAIAHLDTFERKLVAEYCDGVRTGLSVCGPTAGPYLAALSLAGNILECETAKALHDCAPALREVVSSLAGVMKEAA